MPGIVNLFPGQVPIRVYSQIGVIDIERFKDVYLPCSGSYRTEQWFSATHPDKRLHSNDISLLSCSIGRYLTGQDNPIRFKDQLAFIEGACAAVGESPLTRLGAVFMALELRDRISKNEVIADQMASYARDAVPQLQAMLPRLQKFIEGIKIASFVGGDLHDHVDRAIAAGGLIVAYPPTDGTTRYRRESLFAKLEACVEWNIPTYGEYDPKKTGELLHSIAERGGFYIFGAEYEVPGHEARTFYQSGRGKPVRMYTNLPSSRTSVIIKRGTKPAEFNYEVCTEADLTPDARVEVIPIPMAFMVQLKDVFYKAGLIHSPAHINMVVLINGKLCGGYSFADRGAGEARAPAGYGKLKRGQWAYVLADFAVGLGHRRLAKLVSLISASRPGLAYYSHVMVVRPVLVVTSTFSDNPVSMKYRDIMTQGTRVPVTHPATGNQTWRINYHTEVFEETLHELYTRWYNRWGRPDRGSKSSRKPARGDRGPKPEPGGPGPQPG